MTAQPRTHAAIPVRPFAFLFVLMLGIVIGVVAGRWNDSNSSASGAVSRPAPAGALEPSSVPAPLTAAEQQAADIRAHGDAFPDPFAPAPEVIAVRAAIAPTFDELLATAIAQHDADFPAPSASMPASALESTIIVAPSVDEQLATARAEHDAHFPQLAAPGAPFVMDR